MLFVLLIPFNANANADKLDLDALLRSEDYSRVVTRLDQHLQSRESKRDAAVWAITLLQSARLRALQSKHKEAIDYLQTQPWPEDALAQSVLRLGSAHEIEQFLNHKSWELVSAGDRKGGTDSAELSQLINTLKKHYRSVFEFSKQNVVSLEQAKAYLSDSDYPSYARGYLADMAASRWMEFLTDDLYWSAQQQKSLRTMTLESLLSFEGTKGISPDLHPLQQIQGISARLFEWHKTGGRKQAAFEVTRYYTDLLGKHFSSNANSHTFSDYLEKHLRELGSQYPWWSMGKYQQAMFRQKMQHKNALLEAHDLAVRASIAHPGSLGAQRSQELLSELEYQEFSVSGQRSSRIGQASLKVSYRNLYRLYFRAWRISDPLPTSLNENQQKAVIEELLKQPAEVAWVSELTDYPDLHHHEVQLTPQIYEKGQWLLMASPQAEFGDVISKLQLLNLNLSDYVAGVSYHNGEFRVSVYDGKQGRALPNITAELLRVQKGATDVLATAKTNVHGIAKLKRQKDAEHYQVRLQHGVDRSLIDVPGLLPLHDERRWSTRKAKAVVMTDRELYRPGESILWTILARGPETTSNGYPKPFNNQVAWVKLFNSEQQLVTEQRVKTSSLGFASGEFRLPDSLADNACGTWFIESSWQGKKIIRIQRDKKIVLEVDDLGSRLLPNQSMMVSGRAKYEGMKSGLVKWQLRRISYLPNDELHEQVDVEQGGAPIKEHRFRFNTRLVLPESAELLRHRFELRLDFQSNGQSLKVVTKTLTVNTAHRYLTILSDKAFYESELGVRFKLRSSDSQWQGVAGKSQWYLYNLISPNQSVALEDASAQHLMVGALQQNGDIFHDASGIAELHLENLAVGVYRLRLRGEEADGKAHPSHVAKLDFIVAKSGRENPLGATSILLAQRADISVGQTLKLLAGSGVSGQWVRLNILQQGKNIASQMLSPGIHLLEFPVSESHQGGLGFNLEWVEQNQIYNKDIQVSVPWGEKRLQLAITKHSLPETETHVLQVMNARGKPLNDTETAVLVYYNEAAGIQSASEEWLNLASLYPQSKSAMIRLDNNGPSYPYYFRGSRRIASSVVAKLRQPEIRYSDNRNDQYLEKDTGFDILPMMMNSDEDLSRVSLMVASHTPQRQEPIDPARTSVRGGGFLQQGVLDDQGRLTLHIPAALQGKRIRVKILAIGAGMETGTLSTHLR